ncbi:hypothetical protein CSHISOI_04645 [Colletotrichum shisoi]|uniref:Uncharacterized protein n=1 Tax=Colletotrichum shisoi TaxID=2078593 RepID=A0A5Q4BWV1_9PEZI|nr:hypothetical protein CSHISOI_04645 [Colletotrichum shisoi]
MRAYLVFLYKMPAAAVGVGSPNGCVLTIEKAKEPAAGSWAGLQMRLFLNGKYAVWRYGSMDRLEWTLEWAMMLERPTLVRRIEGGVVAMIAGSATLHRYLL